MKAFAFSLVMALILPTAPAYAGELTCSEIIKGKVATRDELGSHYRIIRRFIEKMNPLRKAEWMQKGLDEAGLSRDQIVELFEDKSRCKSWDSSEPGLFAMAVACTLIEKVSSRPGNLDREFHRFESLMSNGLKALNFISAKADYDTEDHWHYRHSINRGGSQYIGQISHTYSPWRFANADSYHIIRREVFSGIKIDQAGRLEPFIWVATKSNLHSGHFMEDGPVSRSTIDEILRENPFLAPVSKSGKRIFPRYELKSAAYFKDDGSWGWKWTADRRTQKLSKKSPHCFRLLHGDPSE